MYCLLTTPSFLAEMAEMASDQDLSHFLSSRSDAVDTWSSWTRSTRASVRSQASASHSSVSNRTADPWEVLAIDPPQSNFTYPLSSVIGHLGAASRAGRHDYSCQKVAQWIRTNDPDLSPNSGTTQRVQVGVSLPRVMCDDSLWISPRKHPDVSWWCDDEVIVQIEVVSDYNLGKTMNKLCLGLVDQLRSWKNRLSTVSSVAGFLFPISNDQKNEVECGQCVYKVQLNWSDEHFRYGARASGISAGSVWATLHHVKTSQQGVFDSLKSNPNHHFTLPMSEQYIQDHFTSSARQVKSGESVVILNDRNAYKRPLGFRATSRLHVLNTQHTTSAAGASYTAGAFPEMFDNTLCFFRFRKYRRPLTLSDIQRNQLKHTFVKATIESLLVLHDEVNIAHLDIRIENICWDNSDRVVFVDFDRSAPKNELVVDMLLTGWYGNSLMYPSTPDWTAEKVDFRQVAIMIGHIEGNDNPHSTPPGLDSEFVRKLFQDGKFTICVCVVQLLLALLMYRCI